MEREQGTAAETSVSQPEEGKTGSRKRKGGKKRVNGKTRDRRKEKGEKTVKSGD